MVYLWSLGRRAAVRNDEAAAAWLTAAQVGDKAVEGVEVKEMMKEMHEMMKAMLALVLILKTLKAEQAVMKAMTAIKAMLGLISVVGMVQALHKVCDAISLKGLAGHGDKAHAGVRYVEDNGVRASAQDRSLTSVIWDSCPNHYP